jgi:hypothetical protein
MAGMVIAGRLAGSGAKRWRMALRFGRPAGREIGGEDGGEFGLAGAFMGDGEEFDHDPAGIPGRCLLEHVLECLAISVAREELAAVDEIEQSHRLAAQAVDDVAVVDDMAVPAVRPWPAARECHQRGGGEEQLEPVVVEAHP